MEFKIFSILLKDSKQKELLSIEAETACGTKAPVLGGLGFFFSFVLCLSREGRAALVSSFAVVKYLTLYGLIQFVGTALLFWVSV